jgi:hypothetical protein
MQTKNILKLFSYVAALMLVSAGCSKYDDYKKFIDDGEILYIGKADSVRSFPGNNRVKLAWTVSDPKITRAKVFWNNGIDSFEFVVNKKGSALDTVEVVIDELQEASYLFAVYCFDDEGNSSVRSEVEENVYGENYRLSLIDRGLIEVQAVAGVGALFQWSGSETTEAGVELTYTNNDGEEKKLIVEKDSTTTLLNDYKTGTDIFYRTLFLPVPAALDTFYTNGHIIEAPIVTYPMLDPAKFAEYPLPGDVPSAWGWILPFLWDGSADEGRGFHTPDIPLPHHFNIDLGVTATLREMKTWQRSINVYDGGNVKKFEIWGSNAPAADGSYTGWTKLLDGESVKPSGLPLGTVTQADIDQAAAGEIFVFPEGTPPVRYIRFNILENWAPQMSAHIMEAKFWGEY